MDRPEKDRHNNFCFVCSRFGELLCCSTCTLVFHLQCLDPPLSEPPTGIWACSECRNETSLDIQKQKPLANPAKRGRGRPRKHPLVIPQQGAEAVPVVLDAQHNIYLPKDWVMRKVVKRGEKRKETQYISPKGTVYRSKKAVLACLAAGALARAASDQTNAGTNIYTNTASPRSQGGDQAIDNVAKSSFFHAHSGDMKESGTGGIHHERLLTHGSQQDSQRPVDRLESNSAVREPTTERGIEQASPAKPRSPRISEIASPSGSGSPSPLNLIKRKRQPSPHVASPREPPSRSDPAPSFAEEGKQTADIAGAHTQINTNAPYRMSQEEGVFGKRLRAGEIDPERTAKKTRENTADLPETSAIPTANHEDRDGAPSAPQASERKDQTVHKHGAAKISSKASRVHFSPSGNHLQTNPSTNTLRTSPTGQIRHDALVTAEDKSGRDNVVEELDGGAEPKASSAKDSERLPRNGERKSSTETKGVTFKPRPKPISPLRQKGQPAELLSYRSPPADNTMKSVEDGVSAPVNLQTDSGFKKKKEKPANLRIEAPPISSSHSPPSAVTATKNSLKSLPQEGGNVPSRDEGNGLSSHHKPKSNVVPKWVLALVDLPKLPWTVGPPIKKLVTEAMKATTDEDLKKDLKNALEGYQPDNASLAKDRLFALLQRHGISSENLVELRNAMNSRLAGRRSTPTGAGPASSQPAQLLSPGSDNGHQTKAGSKSKTAHTSKGAKSPFSNPAATQAPPTQQMAAKSQASCKRSDSPPPKAASKTSDLHPKSHSKVGAGKLKETKKSINHVAKKANTLKSHSQPKILPFSSEGPTRKVSPTPLREQGTNTKGPPLLLGKTTRGLVAQATDLWARKVAFARACREHTKTLSGLSCRICKLDDRFHLLMICDRCNNACHRTCVTSSQVSGSFSVWRCSACTKNQNGLHDSAGGMSGKKAQKTAMATGQSSHAIGTSLKSPTTSHARGDTFRRDNLQSFMYSIWRGVWSLDGLKIFAIIDGKKDDDYSRVVSHSLDLITVRRNIIMQQYSSLEAFKTDLDVIWANATLFYGTSNPFSDAAEVLSAATHQFVQVASKLLSALTRDPIRHSLSSHLSDTEEFQVIKRESHSRLREVTSEISFFRYVARRRAAAARAAAEKFLSASPSSSKDSPAAAKSPTEKSRDKLKRKHSALEKSVDPLKLSDIELVEAYDRKMRKYLSASLGRNGNRLRLPSAGVGAPAGKESTSARADTAITTGKSSGGKKSPLHPSAPEPIKRATENPKDESMKGSKKSLKSSGGHSSQHTAASGHNIAVNNAQEGEASGQQTSGHVGRPVSLSSTEAQAAAQQLKLNCRFVEEGQHGEHLSKETLVRQWQDGLRGARKSTKIGQSRIQGLGLFAQEDIPVNTFVEEYEGERIRDAVAEKRLSEYGWLGQQDYMFRVDEDTILDATRKGNRARYINHSCAPNCKPHVIRDADNVKHIVIFTNKAVAAGEEITIDYQYPVLEHKILCACNTLSCRRYLK